MFVCCCFVGLSLRNFLFAPKTRTCESTLRRSTSLTTIRWWWECVQFNNFWRSLKPSVTKGKQRNLRCNFFLFKEYKLLWRILTQQCSHRKIRSRWVQDCYTLWLLWTFSLFVIVRKSTGVTRSPNPTPVRRVTPPLFCNWGYPTPLL